MPIEGARRVADRLRTSPSTRAARRRAGKELRERVPRSTHADWSAPPDRRDPLEILRESDQHRLEHLVPIRYGRMASTPFAFFRGSAAIMAADLAPTPVSGLRAQLCGDAHLSNFGLFATPERDQVFDVNDFDETLAGPWEWDVKRLATSAVLAGQQLGLSRDRSRRAAEGAVRAYRRYLRSLADLPYLATWYRHFDLGHLPAIARRQGQRALRKGLGEAERRTQFEAMPHLAVRVAGKYRIRDDPPLLYHHRRRGDRAAIRRAVEEYIRSLPDERRVLLERYRFEDVVEKVVGVGSVGTMTQAVLLVGDADVPDPLFLQVKEATASVLEPYAGKSPYANHGQRVVTGQHLMQEASDIFLGWSQMAGRDFYVRQLQDHKGSVDIDRLSADELGGYAALCGAALARAHARSGDPAAIGGYLGSGRSFDAAIATFAERYAGQTVRDHAALTAAIQQGRVHARLDI